MSLRRSSIGGTVPRIGFTTLGAPRRILGQVTIPERLDGRLVVIDTVLPLWVEHEGGNPVRHGVAVTATMSFAVPRVR